MDSGRDIHVKVKYSLFDRTFQTVWIMQTGSMLLIKPPVSGNGYLQKFLGLSPVNRMLLERALGK
jgi:hypothetical protein